MSSVDHLKRRFSGFRRTAFLVGAGAIFVWVTFFDSHSMISRIKWHREKVQLERQNEKLQTEIDDLRSRLDQPLTDSDVERIARERHGMSRDNETVYPLRTEN